MPSPETLVEALRRRGDLRDSRVADAFLSIPRAAFLPGIPLEQVYADEAIATKRDETGTVTSSSSQPSMMVLMLEQLRVKPGHNILEIGTGTGYNAAIMQYLVGERGHITTVELDPQLAETAMTNLQRVAMGSLVRVVQADGAGGFAPRASYDRIIATAGIWDVPRAWVQQMKPRGVLVAPFWLEGFQYSAAFHLQPDGTLYSEHNLPCGFIRLKGAAIGDDMTYRVGKSLYLQASGIIDPVQIEMLLSNDADTAYLGYSLSPQDYTFSVIPYLALNLPENMTLAAYGVLDDAMPYGIDGGGFAIIGPGSACFVTARGNGKGYSFGGADAILAMQDILTRWNHAGRPRLERLRLRLSPISAGSPNNARGKVFRRRDHYVEAWFA